MKWIAQQSGGGVLDDADAGRLARQFDEQLSRSRPQRITRAMAWDRWWVLLAAFGLWAGRLGTPPLVGTCLVERGIEKPADCVGRADGRDRET